MTDCGGGTGVRRDDSIKCSLGLIGCTPNQLGEVGTDDPLNLNRTFKDLIADREKRKWGKVGYILKATTGACARF